MQNSIDCLVTTDWLAANIANEEVAVLDASRHLPAALRDARAEFEEAHIPGALFFHLESLVDTNSSTPSALPNAQQVAQRLAELGIRPDQTIILYDDSAVKTSARAWFALKAHGLDRVAILDGGLTKWRTEGRELHKGAGNIQATPPANLQSAQGVVSKADMQANINRGGFQVLDARSADRVFGIGIDPVHGGQNGRIPGSFNLPFGEVFNADGTFKSASELEKAFEQAGIDLSRPVVTTCGSGVTASVLLFALHLIGKTDTALYDGSWQEWEADPDTPKEQGPAA